MKYQLNDGSIVEIKLDHDPPNPQIEFSNLWTLIGWHRNYSIGLSDKAKRDGLQWAWGSKPGERGLARLASRAFESPERLNEYLADHPDRFILLPVYMYDHLGLALSLSPFSCQWDSGQVGHMIAPLESLKSEYSVPAKNWTGLFKRWALHAAKSELKQYEQFVSGDAWGYVRTLDGEHLDSCWGYYGSDHEKSGLFDASSITELQGELIED